MIFRVGEIVRVVSSSACQSEFLGMIGRIKRSALETEFPFCVEFKLNNKKIVSSFNHKELLLLNKADDALDIYYYYRSINE